MEGYHVIAEEAARLASRVPATVIETVVARLERSDGSDSANLRGQIALAIPTPDYRGAVISLLDRWRTQAPEISAQAVGAALVTASLLAKKRREDAVEVVWTRPRPRCEPAEANRTSDPSSLELRSESHPDRELRN